MCSMGGPWDTEVFVKAPDRPPLAEPPSGLLLHPLLDLPSCPPVPDAFCVLGTRKDQVQAARQVLRPGLGPPPCFLVSTTLSGPSGLCGVSFSS